MKLFLILSVLAVCVLCFGCASTGKNQRVVSEDFASKNENIAPKWITDQGRLEFFPDSFFVSQLAYGSTAQECKEKASASISEYIKSSVVSSTSSSYFYMESGEDVKEDRELHAEIKVSTNNNLYKIEYTNPYYFEDLEQYVCTAFINREQAFNFVKPKLEIAKNQFPQAYHKALEKDSLLDKIIGIRKSQIILHDFYEVYDFARAILPEEAKVYENVDFLASESLVITKELCSSVLIKIDGVGDTDLLELSGVITELSNQFKEMGFITGKSLKANCIALVEVKSVITETKSTYETYPELSIKLIEKGAEKISYTKKLSKVAGFDKDTVIRRTNLSLCKEVRTSFVDECF